MSPVLGRLTRQIIQPDTPSLSRLSISSYVLAALALLFVLVFHLLPALLAGLLVYALVNTLAAWLQRHLPGMRTHRMVVAMLAVVVVVMLTLVIAATIALLNSENDNPTKLLERMAPLLERARSQLPEFVATHLPLEPTEMRAAVVDWSRVHAAQLQLVGRHAVTMIVHLLAGVVLGALLALDGANTVSTVGGLSGVLKARCANLAIAFRDIVFAQAKISALNTSLTGSFLLIALPLFGVSLPLAKTLVVVTFVVGLLPVIGNLISNTLIFVVALSLSMYVALAALAFLIVIHKLEYFLNARIVGKRILASSWELLIAMLALEAAFGTPGLIAAPIYYAYLKRELMAIRLI